MNSRGGETIDVEDLDLSLNHGVTPHDVTVGGEPLLDNERTRSNDFRAEERVFLVYDTNGDVNLLRYSHHDHPEERGVSVVHRGDVSGEPRTSVDEIEGGVDRRDVAEIIYRHVEYLANDIVDAVLEWAHELDLYKHGVSFDIYDDNTPNYIIDDVVEETELDYHEAELVVLEDWFSDVASGKYSFRFDFSGGDSSGEDR